MAVAPLHPTPARRPWSVDRAWADPLIAALALLALLLVQATLRHRARPQPPASRATLAGRLQEPLLAGPRRLGLARWLQPDWRKAAEKLPEGWDRAVVAVLAAEAGALAEAQAVARQAPPSFAPVLAEAYGNAAPAGSSEQRDVREALAGTSAGCWLEARLDPAAGPALRARADTLLSRRLGVVLGAGALLCLMGLGGLGFATVLAVRPARTWPSLPAWPLEGRAMALVLLAWLNLLLLSTTLVQPLVARLPLSLQPLGLPLAFSLHALSGLALVVGFSGWEVREIRRQVFPGPALRSLAWAVGFLGLALVAVLALGLLLAPLRGAGPAPQQDLLEGFAALQPWPVTLALFLTAAVLAPLFEEFLFRGVLLPWCAGRWGRIPAIAGAALAFGAAHLLPAALPTLGALGVVLGLAYCRSGDLRTAVLVHGCWNGAVFIFVRALA